MRLQVNFTEQESQKFTKDFCRGGLPDYSCGSFEEPIAQLRESISQSTTVSEYSLSFPFSIPFSKIWPDANIVIVQLE